MEKPLNKQELIAAVADAVDLPKVKAGEAVDALFKTIADTLAAGGEVRLVGFGSFVRVHRKATKGRNPQTKMEIDIPASNSVRFKPGKSLKEAVN